MGRNAHENELENLKDLLEENEKEYGYFVDDAAKGDNTKRAFINEKVSFLLSEIDKSRNGLYRNLELIGIREEHLFPYEVDDFIEYYSLTHMLYIAVKELEQGKTDFIDKFNKYKVAQENYEKFTEQQDDGTIPEDENFPEQETLDEFRDFKKSYFPKIRKTLEYKRISENVNDLDQNINALIEILSTQYTFVDNPEYHEALESDDSEFIEKIEKQKLEKYNEKKRKEEEKKKEEEAKTEKEREERYKRYDEQVAQYEKEEESGEYKKDIDNQKQNEEATYQNIEKYKIKTFTLQKHHPDMEMLMQKLNFATEALYPIKNEKTEKKKAAELIKRFVVVNQLVSYALDLNNQGRSDEYNRLASLTSDDIERILIQLSKKAEKEGVFDKYLENANYNDNLNNRRKLITVHGIEELCHSLNSDLENQIIICGISAIKQDIDAKLDASYKALDGAAKEGDRLFGLFHIMKSDIRILKDEVLIKNDMISDEVIHRISRIVAASQIMLNDKNDKDFIDNLTGDDLERKINLFAEFLEKSDYINTIFRSKDPVQNSRNLAELVSKPIKLAQYLNELDYSKTLFTGKEILKQGSSVSEFEKQLMKDKLWRIHLEEEKALELGQMKDGYYDVGREFYLYTKNELVKMGDQLKIFAQKNNQVFTHMSEEYVPPVPKEGEELVESFDDSLHILFDGLTDVSEILMASGNRKDDFWDKKLDGFFNDANDMTRIAERLDKMIASCENLMLYDVSKEDDFQKIYSAIINARARIDEVTSGSLRVPFEEENGNTVENGKKVSFIKADNPDMGNIIAGFKEDSETSNVELSWVGAKEPLFPHDPCSMDIIQGPVGDCYFIATLASIATKSPQTIRDMMSYNANDDTVTVRFYNMDDEPVYVTVDNTVPEIKYTDSEGKEVKKSGYSKGARWVQIMEKAFEKSGLVDDTQQGKSINSGGKRSYALKTLLGPMVKGSSIDEINKFQNFDIPLKHEEIFPKEYKKEDVELYNKLQALHRDGAVLTAGISKSDSERRSIDRTGLPGNHAYGVMGFSEENGVKYIHIKNPHGTTGRTYDEFHYPEQVPAEEACGESKIELRDFLNNFTSVVVSELKTTPLNRHNEAIVEKEEMLYADTIREMDYYLQECGQAKAEEGETLPKELLDLRKKSTLASEAIKDPFIKPNKLNAVLDDYFKSAREYVSFRDQNPQTEEKEKSPYAAICYFSANVITKLHNKFLENQISGIDKAEFFDVEDLKNDALKHNDGDSLAKTSSIGTVNEINNKMEVDKQRRNEESINNAKKLVEANDKLLKSKKKV